MSEDERTLFVGGLSDRVTEELLYELFLQAGPLEKVKIPTDKEGRPRKFAFVTFLHDVSVAYSKQIMEGIQLFGRTLSLQNRGNNSESPRSSPRSSPHYNSDPQQNSRHVSFNRSNTWHGQDSNRGHSPRDGQASTHSPQYDIPNPYGPSKGGYMSVNALRGHNSSGNLNDLSMQPRERPPHDIQRQRVLDQQQISLNMHRNRDRSDDRYNNRDKSNYERNNRGRNYHPYSNDDRDKRRRY